MNSIKYWLKKPWLWVLIIVVLILLFFIFNRDNKIDFESEVISRSDVREIISVTGELAPAEEVDLSFEVNGTLRQVLVSEGERVALGQPLMVLDSRARESELEVARAGLIQAEARLQELRSGLVSVERQAAQARLRSAEVSLENARRKLLVSDLRAYFIGTPFDQGLASYDPPVITGSYTGSETGEYKITLYASGSQSGYSFLYSGLESGAGEATAVKPISLGSRGLFIQFPPNFAVSGVEWVVPIPNDRSSSYVLNKQAYDQAEATYLQAKADFDLAVSGSREEQIRSAEGAVAGARAQVRSAEVALSKTRLTAPFSGVVKSVPVSLGQSVAFGQRALILSSDADFHISLFVPEADVANLAVGDEAEVRLSAFPGRLFRAVVTYVSPVAENRDGVASFKTKLDLIDFDDRMRVGMTVDTDIFSDSRSEVLAIPGRAIIRSSGRNFVRVVEGKEIKEREVEIGLRGSDGRVEILSGLNEGEEVITFIREEDLNGRR